MICNIPLQNACLSVHETRIQLNQEPDKTVKEHLYGIAKG